MHSLQWLFFVPRALEIGGTRAVAAQLYLAQYGCLSRCDFRGVLAVGGWVMIRHLGRMLEANESRAQIFKRCVDRGPRAGGRWLSREDCGGIRQRGLFSVGVTAAAETGRAGAVPGEVDTGCSRGGLAGQAEA